MRKDLFAEMIEGIGEARKYVRGEKANVRVTRFMKESEPLKPSEIRKIRVALGITQVEFAEYLGTKVGTVRSWEQGVRRPRRTALRLLTIARRSPAALLERK
jgi:putative transcriptional regulator